MQAGRKLWVAGRYWIVADPEVDAAMRRKENGVPGNQIIVNPGGRRAEENPCHDHGSTSKSTGERALPTKKKRGHEHWHQKQNGCNAHGRETHQPTQKQKTTERRGVLTPNDLPNNKPKHKNQPCRRHDDDGVSLRRLKAGPTECG